MITLKEIKEQQDKLNEMIEKYEVMNLKKDTYDLEYPDHDADLFLIDAEGDVEDVCYCKAYESEFRQGHIRFTEEEAKLEVKRRNLITRFEQFRDNCNRDWKPDFMNRDEYKYSIIVFENKMDCDKSFGKNSFCQFGYFKNEDDCKQAIELFGDEIKELYCE